MDIQYIAQKKELQQFIYNFVQNENGNEDDFLELINFVDINKEVENPEELFLFLSHIVAISNNYYRYDGFIQKIEKIILYFQDRIKLSFSNFKIFKIFESNILITLFLFQSKIIIPDDFLITYILSRKDLHFVAFIYEEIKEFIDPNSKIQINYEMAHNYAEKSNVISLVQPKNYANIPSYYKFTSFDDFERKRKIGENDLYICSLIRKDSVEDFIAYVNKNNISSNQKIKPSFFETNSFLIKNEAETTLIDYAAFFGSIEIFQYLLFNNAKLNPNLWLYAIHGKNSEIIHLLEENKVALPSKSYYKCLKESIQCHYNDIANYFKRKIDENNKKYVERFKLLKNTAKYGFRYYNYEFIPENLNNRYLIEFLCKYGYLTLVDYLLTKDGMKSYENRILNFITL